MRFDELPSDRIHSIIEVNVKAVMRTTSLVLPHMIPRGNGLILNLGSVVSQIPSAYLAVYSGSKAFLKFWSMAVAQELKDTGVLVEHLNTWFVSTAMSKIRKPTWQVPSAASYVEYAIKYAGQGSLSWTPYWSHAMFAFVVDNVVTKHRAMDWFGTQQREVRAFAMRRKLEREAAAKAGANGAVAK
jgi:17beta-estradiol 17-dehydrogenase / very-long-chain 3-oxoacyl-CoA reductase